MTERENKKKIRRGCVIVFPVQLITYCHIDPTDKKITLLLYNSERYSKEENCLRGFIRFEGVYFFSLKGGGVGWGGNCRPLFTKIKVKGKTNSTCLLPKNKGKIYSPF